MSHVLTAADAVTLVNADAAAPVPVARLAYVTPAGSGDRLPRMAVEWVVLLHVLTFGLSSVIWFNLMHGRLPRVRDDDPTPGRAIGWLFVPVVNVYWVFFTYLRLCDRVAEQRRLHNLPESGAKGLCWIACATMLVPFVNVASILVLQPALFAVLQAEINELHPLGIVRPTPPNGEPTSAPDAQSLADR